MVKVAIRGGAGVWGMFDCIHLLLECNHLQCKIVSNVKGALDISP